MMKNMKVNKNLPVASVKKRKCTGSENSERLSPHFSLFEMTRSGVAIACGISNVPSAAAIENLRLLCVAVLEPLRRRYGRILITSGYRSRELNRKVGGAKNSQHLRGEAADIYIGSREKAEKYAKFIVENTDFDQLIREPMVPGGNCNPRWLHVSYTKRRANRHQVL